MNDDEDMQRAKEDNLKKQIYDPHKVPMTCQQYKINKHISVDLCFKMEKNYTF